MFSLENRNGCLTSPIAIMHDEKCSCKWFKVGVLRKLIKGKRTKNCEVVYRVNRELINGYNFGHGDVDVIVFKDDETKSLYSFTYEKTEYSFKLFGFINFSSDRINYALNLRNRDIVRVDECHLSFLGENENSTFSLFESPYNPYEEDEE